MRKTFFLSMIMAVVAVFCACDNVEYATESHLYGFWHLVSVDTLETQRSADMSQKRIFWSVESNLVELCDRDGVYPSVICEFERVGDSLRFSTLFFSNRNEGDVLIEDVEALKPYGLSSLQPQMKIEKHASGKLVLNTGSLILKFRKL